MTATNPCRYVLLGSESVLTGEVLRGLLPDTPPIGFVYDGYATSGTTGGILPSRQPAVPLTRPIGLPELAASAGIPVFPLRGQAPGARSDIKESVRDLQPDVLLIACFDHILSPGWLALGGAGTLNVHPSLLPAYRGRTPLSAQRRDRVSWTGVTVHWATPEIDGGPILAQYGFRPSWDETDDAIGRRQGEAASCLVRAVFAHRAAARHPNSPAAKGTADRGFPAGRDQSP